MASKRNGTGRRTRSSTRDRHASPAESRHGTKSRPMRPAAQPPRTGPDEAGATVRDGVSTAAPMQEASRFVKEHAWKVFSLERMFNPFQFAIQAATAMAGAAMASALGATLGAANGALSGLNSIRPFERAGRTQGPEEANQLDEPVSRGESSR